MPREETRAWRLVGVAAGIAAMIEGAVLASLEGANLTTLVYVLIVLGGLAAGSLAAAVLAPSKLGRYLRVPALIALPLAVAIMVISVGLAFSSKRSVELGLESQPVYIVAIFIAMMFFVGLALFIASAMSERKLKVTSFLAYGGGAAAAAEGLVVVSIAARTKVAGLGWVTANTVQLTGILLLAVGLAFIAISILSELTKRGVSVFSLGRSVFAVLIVIAGIGLTVLATPIFIKGIGNIREIMIMLGGLQLAVLGLFTLAMCGLSANPDSPRLRRLAILAAVFLAFLIPMAVLTAGKVL